MNKQRNFFSILISILVFSFVFDLNAAINKSQIKKEMNQFITAGSLIGGKAGKGFSLLNASRVVTKDKKAERLILNVGDAKGVSYKGQPGYFHAQITPKTNRMSIDFSQMGISKLSEAELKKAFKDSDLVKQIKVTKDADELTTNVTIFFHKPIKTRVYSVGSSKAQAQVVVDFFTLKK